MRSAVFEADQPKEQPKLERSTDQDSLTLTHLETIAFQYNPTLAAAAARMDAARGRQVQAGLYPNPVVGYHATEIGNLGTAGQQGGFISQRVITGGKLGLDQAVAEKEIDEAHSQFHAQERRVLSDVRVRFYEALVAQRRVELTAELERIGDELVKATRKLVKGQLGTDNDLLQAEIRADQAKIVHENARNESLEAWRRLTAVVGSPNLVRNRLKGDLDDDLPSFSWEESYQLVLGNNPDLIAAQARVERASRAMKRARREPIPNIDFLLSVRHHNVTGSDVANVQVGIPIPVFNRNQGNIQTAESKWIAATKEVERRTLELRDRLAVVYRRFANAKQQVRRYRQRIVPKAKKSLELVRNSYDKGQVNYLTLLTAQQTYIDVNLSYLRALRDFWSSAKVIEGQLLTGSLSSPR